MPKFSYGDERRDQAWNLVSALIKRADKKGVQWWRDPAEKYYLIVQARLNEISGWTESDSKLSDDKVSELLNYYLGDKFLNIVTDKRKNKRGRGSENWNFHVALWSKDLGENEKRFLDEWSNAKKHILISKHSQESTSNYQISSDWRADVCLVFDKKDEDLAKEIEEKLSRNRIKVIMGPAQRIPGQSYKIWEKQVIEQINSIAVLVSSHDSALWKDRETRSFLKEFDKSRDYDMKKGLPIPVLLPNAPLDSFQQKSVPRCLKGDKKAVDFTKGVSAEKIDDLIYGITGKKQSKKQKLMTLMSCNGVNSPKIVLPDYPIEKRSSETIDVENQFETNNLHQQATENLQLIDSETLIPSDVDAYAGITSLFSPFNLPTPQLSPGRVNIDFNNQEKNTWILIGLSSRQFKVLNAKSIPGKYFMVKTDKVPTPHEKAYSFYIECGQFNDSNKLQPLRRWAPFKENQEPEYDFAVFAKFEFGTQTIIVCGGITAEATKRLVDYLTIHWESVYDRLKFDKKCDLAPNDPFAVVIRTPNDKQYSDFEIRRACIRKNV